VRESEALCRRVGAEGSIHLLAQNDSRHSSALVSTIAPGSVQASLSRRCYFRVRTFFRSVVKEGGN
jgi:hypothetical protein